MKKSKLLVNLTAIVISLMSILILVILVYNKNDLKVIANKDSYALEYASNKKLKKEELALSESEKYQVNIENYSYNILGNEIEITEYKGVSDELIIPSNIDNKVVSKISKDAFKNSNLKKIILPNTIKNIYKEDYKDIEILCYKGDFCSSLKEDKNLNVDILSSSDYYDFNLPKLEYEYNFNNSKIEIVKYLGNSKDIIIPTSINGYEVSKINLNLDNIDSIYIPQSVKDINISYSTSEYNNLFFLAIISSILALTLFLIFNLYVSSKTKEEKFNVAPLRIVSFTYLLFILIFTLISKLQEFDFKIALIIVILMTVIYVIISISLIFSKMQIENQDKLIKNTGSFNKEVLDILENIEVLNSDIEAEITKIEDLITYSDPISNDSTKDIEKEIINLLLESTDKDLNYFKNITKLINKRNKICKDSK